VLKVEKLLNIRNLYDPANIEYNHHVQQALRAHVLYQLDRDYVVKRRRRRAGSDHRRRVHRAADAGPALVRRPAPGGGSQGRRQDPARKPDPGHHHLPELFPHVQEAGRDDRHGGNRSGRIPEDLQPRRDRDSHQPQYDPQGNPDVVYRTEDEKFRNAAKEIKTSNETGQPVLVGTISVENPSGFRILKRMGVRHEVLNAKNHEREASIVAQAGRKSAWSRFPPTWPAAAPTSCWAATRSS
jgi:preprotein translocase subunit SecA